MQPNDILGVFIPPLNRLAVPYMVTGSVAGIIYGEPRLTHDVDLVVQLSPLHIRRLPDSFPETEFYCPPTEVITIESDRPNRGHFNIIHHATGLKADFYTIGDEPLLYWGMERRQEFTVDDCPVWLAPPEYVILKKLEYYQEGGSEKHLRDIRHILAVSGNILDQTSLNAWISKLNQQQTWTLVHKP